MITHSSGSAAQIVHGKRENISQIQREARRDEKTALRIDTCTHTNTEERAHTQQLESSIINLKSLSPA